MNPPLLAIYNMPSTMTSFGGVPGQFFAYSEPKLFTSLLINNVLLNKYIIAQVCLFFLEK